MSKLFIRRIGGSGRFKTREGESTTSTRSSTEISCSYIRYLLSDICNPIFGIWCPKSGIQSNIWYLISEIGYQTAGVWYQNWPFWCWLCDRMTACERFHNCVEAVSDIEWHLIWFGACSPQSTKCSSIRTEIWPPLMATKCSVRNEHWCYCQKVKQLKLHNTQFKNLYYWIWLQPPNSQILTQWKCDIRFSIWIICCFQLNW